MASIPRLLEIDIHDFLARLEELGIQVEPSPFGSAYVILSNPQKPGGTTALATGGPGTFVTPTQALVTLKRLGLKPEEF